jgi:hypothetical protein
MCLIFLNVHYLEELEEIVFGKGHIPYHMEYVTVWVLYGQINGAGIAKWYCSELQAE